jgi:hypothetical protein
VKKVKTSPIKILIADDIAETRENLRKLLSFDGDFSVIGEAATLTTSSTGRILEHPATTPNGLLTANTGSSSTSSVTSSGIGSSWAIATGAYRTKTMPMIRTNIALP